MRGSSLFLAFGFVILPVGLEQLIYIRKKMSQHIKSFVLASSLCLTNALHAAEVVDQANLFGPGATGADVAIQSFIQAAGNISGAYGEVWLPAVINNTTTGQIPGSMAVAIWDSLPDALGANRIAYGIAPFVPVNSGTFASFEAHWSPVVVNPGQSYFLVSTYLPLGTESATIGRRISPNSYAAGAGFLKQFPTSPYTAQDFDYTFRTFQDNQFASAVPEPAEWMLLIFGLGLVSRITKSRHGKS
jgi:hypothetical protein